MQSSKKTPHILVVEDESFQRLALMDIITLCEYEVTAVENGAVALEELKKQENEFDLVLLDLIMPEIDGLELLNIMKNDDNLKEIPVVMMSSSEEMDFISSCLKLGAQDYIIKPLRVQVVRGLSKFFRKQEGPRNTKAEAKNLAAYTLTQELGRGATGAVLLAIRKHDQEKFALKKIPLGHLKENEKRLAENEVQLLKVLVGPTIIRYYDSFSDHENIYIVMELADKGNLSDKIKKQKELYEYFTPDQILDWVAQMALGLMVMHSKKILHRDIKTQNMFLVGDNNVLKIGDFGISKELSTYSDMAKTSCGTPYFMSPEVCKGDQYGQKADMWAMGCVIYEIATLKKPFDAESMTGVFSQIINNDFDPLPPNIDPDIKMLIIRLLNKDPFKRPSIWELSKIPCIYKRIQDFIMKHNCQDMVMQVFQMEPNARSKNGSKQAHETKQEKKSSSFDVERLDEFAAIIRGDIKLQDVKAGWFKVHKNCCAGETLVEWIVDHFGITGEEAQDMCEKMIDKNLLHHVEGKNYFENSEKVFYRFQADRLDIGANMISYFADRPRNALIVIEDLLTQIKQLFLESQIENEDGELMLDTEAALKSSEFVAFQHNCAELQDVSLKSLSRKEKLIFFIDLYQIMFIHKLLRSQSFEVKKPGFVKKLTSMVWNNSSEPKFYYCVDNKNFTLEEIKHGIFRGNKKPPGAYTRYFSGNDPRNKILQGLNDPRLLFMAPDYPDIPEQIEIFKDPKALNNQLEEICASYINKTVCFDDYNGELSIPLIFQAYKDDFGKSDENIVKWIWNYFSGTDQSCDEIQKLIKKKSIMIRYTESS